MIFAAATFAHCSDSSSGPMIIGFLGWNILLMYSAMYGTAVRLVAGILKTSFRDGTLWRWTSIVNILLGPACSRSFATRWKLRGSPGWNLASCLA